MKFDRHAPILLITFSAVLKLVQAQECRDSPGWHMSDSVDQDCQWFSEPFGDDDFEYYDDDIDEADNRCTWYGNDGEFRGETANEACCVCGGGYIEPNVPSFSPAFTMEPTEIPCYDVPGWHSADKDIFTCEWYGNPVGDDDYYDTEGDTRCGLFGEDEPNFGYTANQACCVCGGGYFGPVVPSVSPTTSNAPTESAQPSLEPSITSTVVCENIPGWADATMTKCPWYAQPVREEDDVYYDEDATRCAMFGDQNANTDGLTANDACCVCGGGTISKIDISSSPTSSPTSVATFAPGVELTDSPIASDPVTPSPDASEPGLPSANPTSAPVLPIVTNTPTMSPVTLAPVVASVAVPTLNAPTAIPVVTPGNDSSSHDTTIDASKFVNFSTLLSVLFALCFLF